MRVTQQFASAENDAACCALLRSAQPGLSILPFGAGQSLGDSCLNDQGALIATCAMNRILDVNSPSGTVIVEPGSSMGQLLDLSSTASDDLWFPAVVPGNMMVTVGGAIANDVHGKNHHAQGTFGHHVESLDLLRSDGSGTCSANENTELFYATLGGLGLTGIVTRARLRLRQVVSLVLDREDIRCESIAEALSLFERGATVWEHQSFWFDPFSETGRGMFTRARHCADADARAEPSSSLMKAMSLVPVPAMLGGSTVWRSIYAMMLRPGPRRRRRLSPQRDVLAPLAAFRYWNRLLGPNGLLHLQLVVPSDTALGMIGSVLSRCRAAGQLPYVASCKMFGNRAPAGLLSFPREGITFALDFANEGSDTRALLVGLQRQVVKAGGAIYPGKDGTMPPDVFRRSFPQWETFGVHVDPRFSSSFWRRVNS